MTKKDVVLKASNGILHAIILIFAVNALTIITEETDEEGGISFIYEAAALSSAIIRVYIAMIVSRIVQYSVAENRNWYFHVKTWIYCSFYVASIAVFICDDDFSQAIGIACLLYMAALLTGRILGLIRKFKLGNIIKTVIFTLIILSVATEMMGIAKEGPGITAYLMLFFIVVQYLIKIIVISFSGVKLNVLIKIIRKTYAVEILAGFALLIFTVSILLQRIEPSINSSSDALWYCFALVTTIGFGDISAVTPAGRLLSVLLGIYGIIVVALITSIIVNFYGETKDSFDEEMKDILGENDNKKGGSGKDDRNEDKASEQVKAYEDSFQKDLMDASIEKDNNDGEK